MRVLLLDTSQVMRRISAACVAWPLEAKVREPLAFMTFVENATRRDP